MTDNKQLVKARSDISNGRLLTIVTAIPFLGSVTKLFYLGSPTELTPLQVAESAQKTLSQTPETMDSLTSILMYFPTLNTNHLATADNFVSTALLIGLIYGARNWKKGLLALKISEQSRSSKNKND